MATLIPIKISDQAKIIQSALNSFVSNLQAGGTASVVSDLRQLWKQAALDSQSMRILICYGGSKVRGSFSVSSALHREDRTWKIAVTKGRGYNSERGDNLTSATGNTTAFFDDVESIRNICRTIKNISAEGPTNDYDSIEPMQLGDLVVDGYLITFTTANDIPKGY